MNITKKSYSVSVKLTDKYNSYGITEGFEADINSNDEQAFSDAKMLLTKRVLREAKEWLNSIRAPQDDDIKID